MDLFAILIDIVMLAILITTIVRFYKKGFFVSLFSVGGSIVAVVLALIFSNPLAVFVFDNFMRGGITARVDSSLSDALPQQSVSVLVEGFTESMPQSLTENLEGFNVPQVLEDLFTSGIELNSQSIVDTAVAPVMISVTSAVVFFFLVFAIKMCFILIERLFYAVDKIPIASQLNSILGGAIGLVPGVINIILVFSAFTLVAMFTSNQIPVINSDTLYATVTGNIFDIVLKSVSGYFSP